MNRLNINKLHINHYYFLGDLFIAITKDLTILDIIMDHWIDIRKGSCGGEMTCLCRVIGQKIKSKI